MLKAALYPGSDFVLKKSAAALVLLLILGGAAYWLQASGQFKAYWPGASVAQVKPEAAKSGQGQRASFVGGSGNGEGRPAER